MGETWDEMGQRLGYAKPPVITPALKAAAAVLVVVPILGILAHLVLALRMPDLIGPYYTSQGMHVVIAVAAVNLVAAFLHHRRTRMQTTFAAWILCFVWMLSFGLLLYVRYKQGQNA